MYWTVGRRCAPARTVFDQIRRNTSVLRSLCAAFPASLLLQSPRDLTQDILERCL